MLKILSETQGQPRKRFQHVHALYKQKDITEGEGFVGQDVPAVSSRNQPERKVMVKKKFIFRQVLFLGFYATFSPESLSS